MREYKTQMEAARKGIVTEELKKVAQKEHLRVEELMPLVAAGKVAICANKNHKCLDPQGVGSMLRTKINVNLGVSRDWKDYDIEMQKVMAAVDMGADAIMDLSSHGDTTGFRRKLTSECPAMIGILFWRRLRMDSAEGSVTKSPSTHMHQRNERMGSGPPAPSNSGGRCMQNSRDLARIVSPSSLRTSSRQL